MAETQQTCEPCLEEITLGTTVLELDRDNCFCVSTSQFLLQYLILCLILLSGRCFMRIKLKAI